MHCACFTVNNNNTELIHSNHESNFLIRDTHCCLAATELHFLVENPSEQRFFLSFRWWAMCGEDEVRMR